MMELVYIFKNFLLHQDLKKTIKIKIIFKLIQKKVEGLNLK